MSWGWRNKPRSVIKTVQWFKYFSNLENENWDYTANKLAANNIKIHPIRRKYYFDAQLEEEDSPINGLSYEDYLMVLKMVKQILKVMLEMILLHINFMDLDILIMKD